jgi:hypothetical protein
MGDPRLYIWFIRCGRPSGADDASQFSDGLSSNAASPRRWSELRPGGGSIADTTFEAVRGGTSLEPYPKNRRSIALRNASSPSWSRVA